MAQTVEWLWRLRVQSGFSRGYHRLIVEEGIFPTLEEHKAILDALMKRDPEAARQAMTPTSWQRRNPLRGILRVTQRSGSKFKRSFTSLLGLGAAIIFAKRVTQASHAKWQWCLLHYQRS